MTSLSLAGDGTSEIIASAFRLLALRAYACEFARLKPCVCTPRTNAVGPFADASASAPACHSCGVRLCQPLAFCGQAMPATLPRFRNSRCRTIASASNTLSGVQGVQPIGNTPARGFPFGDVTIVALV